MSTRTTGREEQQQQALSSMLQPGPGPDRGGRDQNHGRPGTLVPGRPAPAALQWSLASGGRAAMDVTGQLDDYRARCLPHLLTLRMLARYTPEASLPWLAVAEVTQA